MKKRLTTIIIALALILSLAACGQQATDLDGDKDTQAEAKLFSKGAILVKVNPELKVNYNDQGLTTSVEALNDDGIKILKSLDDFINKEVKDVVRSIIKEIDKKGYLFEEIEGKEREIVLEVEKGSVVPEASFIDDIVATVEDLITKEIASNNLDKKPNLVVKDYDDDKDLDDDNNLDKDRDDDRKDLDDDDKKTTDETIVKTIKTTDKKSTTDKDKKVDSSDKNTSGTIPKAVEHDDDDDDDDNDDDDNRDYDDHDDDDNRDYDDYDDDDDDDVATNNSVNKKPSTSSKPNISSKSDDDDDDNDDDGDDDDGDDDDDDDNDDDGDDNDDNRDYDDHDDDDDDDND